MTNDSRWSWSRMIKRITWRPIAPLYWLPPPSAIFTKCTRAISCRLATVYNASAWLRRNLQIHQIAKSKWLRRMDVCTRRHALLLMRSHVTIKAVARDAWTKAADTSKLWEELFSPVDLYKKNLFRWIYVHFLGAQHPQSSMNNLMGSIIHPRPKAKLGLKRLSACNLAMKNGNTSWTDG